MATPALGALDQRLDIVRYLFVRATCYMVICLFELADAALVNCELVWRMLFPSPASEPKGSPSVVIVGGSFSGLRAQRECSGKCRVTLVDLKDYFEYTPGCLRLFIDPSHLRNVARPLPHARNGLIVGELTSIGPHAITVREPGGVDVLVNYDYLLLGTGSTYSCKPISPTGAHPTLVARATAWEEAAAELRTAESVLVLGGGPVGVELAAEVAAAYPGKRITLLTSGGTLCPTLPARVGTVSATWLQNRGVRLVFHARVTRVDGTTVHLSDNSTLSADVVYPCMGGGSPNSHAVRLSFPDSLHASGRVIVDQALRVHGSNGRVFAMGDVMLLPGSADLKLGHTAELNAEVAAENALRSGHGAARLAAYPFGAVGADVPPRVFAVSLGEFSGTIAFNGLVISGVLAAVAKSVIEWTKVAACEERPVGVYFWRFGDAAANWLSRAVLPPPDAQKALGATAKLAR